MSSTLLTPSSEEELESQMSSTLLRMMVSFLIRKTSFTSEEIGYLAYDKNGVEYYLCFSQNPKKKNIVDVYYANSEYPEEKRESFKCIEYFENWCRKTYRKIGWVWLNSSSIR